MGLNISTGEAKDFTPYVKYDAKAGRWYIKQDGNLVEVNNPTFVADFDNIKTGWFDFQPGLAPSISLDISLETPVAKPSERHKRGFEINLFSQNAFGGLVVFSSTAGAVGEVMVELYNQYANEKGSNPKMLPVVQCSGVTPKVGKHGTNYRPNLSIVKWVSRPEAFDSVESSNTPEVNNNAAPSASKPASSISEF